MIELNLNEEEVRLYLKAVLGELPARSENGTTRPDCPFPFHPGGFIYMDPANGCFHCRGGCARGELAVFEMGRAKLPGLREARQAVLRIIETEKEKARLAVHEAKERAMLAEQEAKAAEAKALEALPYGVRKLFKMINRHPGRSRRHLQQSSHVGAYRFRKAIRQLERSRFVTWEDHRVAGGKRRRIYFPVVLSQPSATPTTNDEGNC